MVVQVAIIPDAVAGVVETRVAGNRVGTTHGNRRLAAETQPEQARQPAAVAPIAVVNQHEAAVVPAAERINVLAAADAINEAAGVVTREAAVVDAIRVAASPERRNPTELKAKSKSNR